MGQKINNHQVIKIGSACLFDEQGCINMEILRQKAVEIKALEDRLGIKSTLVVSGAIALGKKYCSEKRQNSELTPTELQRYACRGQIDLMQAYQTAFSGIYSVSQLLLTSKNFRKRRHRKNIRDLIQGDCSNNTITLVNYNDGIDFEQLRKDNEETAAALARYCGSGLLMILGQYEGFMDHGGKLIERIDKVKRIHYKMCNGSSEYGHRGFEAKLDIVNSLLRRGTKVIIAHIEMPIEGIIKGEYGTHFG